jgi:hypothetical protein
MSNEVQFLSTNWHRKEATMPVIQPPPVSKQLQDEIRKAELMHNFISGTVPDKFIGDTDQKLLVAAIYSLTSELHAAILYLLKAGRYDGSALALVRPLIDGAYRAHWIHSCAKPDIVVRIKNGENVYPGLINMAEEIEKKVDVDGMFAAIKPYINALHGYTHGGLEQLGRRFDSTGTAVQPNYSDGEKLEVVKATTAHLTALAIAWCQIVSTDPPYKEPLSKQISDHYVAEYEPPA